MDRTAWKARMLNRKRVRFGEDTCDLIAPVKADQGAGHTISDSTVASNVPCFVEQVRGGSADVVSGGVTVTVSHSIEMPATTATLLIDRHYKIKVHARDGNAQMFFEQPVRGRGSSNAMVTVQAVITDGYRQPGIT